MPEMQDFDIADSSGRMVDEDITDSLSQADPLIKPDELNGDPLISPDVIYAGDISTTVIRFDSLHGKFKRNGELFSGTIDYLKLYDKDKLFYDTDVNLLITATDLVITEGTLTIRQADVTTGLLSSLELNTNYWFYLFNTDLTAISIGIIQVTSE